ncbi:hypothetical protein IFO69_18045 [Echinicola sp. CAU 1574]|uniref:Peptidase M56 domain-containing protein n=1 Tax=Echinicola arenosa TaxID=2774144 RepID=A0ABR9APF5_9BACT|nr:M56 family metallopeptidase [Echinicola arenosa]MBD8490661.1 hypothetical protein [Echinicola arenosa]
MIVYLIKSTISLLILYLAYHFLLSKEKAYQFNRYFLLGSLIFSLCVPFIPSPLKPYTKVVKVTPTFTHFAVEEILPSEQMETNSTPVILETKSKVAPLQIPPLETILMAISFLVSLVLIIRLLIHLRKLYSKIKMCEIIDKGSFKIVLSSGKDLPFTFLRFIFLDKSQFQKGVVHHQLLHHEAVHAHQWHSLDILFIEVLKVIFWFNPILQRYKKAIQSNHEFIADEEVIIKYQDKKSYQYLLLSYAQQHQQNHLVSYSKYSLTKNRITMMNKTKNWQKTAIKVLLTLPIAIGIVSLLAMRPQESSQVQKNNLNTSGLQDDEYLKEYEMLYKDYKRIMNEARLEKRGVRYDETEVERMRQLWALMSKKSREKASKLSMVPAPPILNKKRPSNYQMKEWQKNTDYKIYLDRKEIPNRELKSYNQEDIAFWSYHRNYTSENNGKFNYETEVYLQTNNDFYWTYFMNRTGYDHISAYEKAIEIYFEHQKHPKKYEGQLGGTLNDLQKVFDQIPEWKKEMYKVKTPTEAIKGESKNKGISFSYIPYFKPQKNDGC